MQSTLKLLALLLTRIRLHSALDVNRKTKGEQRKSKNLLRIVKKSTTAQIRHVDILDVFLLQ